MKPLLAAVVAPALAPARPAHGRLPRAEARVQGLVCKGKTFDPDGT